MRAARLLILTALGAAVVACGQRADLRPKPGEPLPPRPLMARATPEPEQLLSPPTYARPERVDELIRRSQPRRTDRFDLPPPTGGSVPLPIGGEKEPVDDISGSSPQ